MVLLVVDYQFNDAHNEEGECSQDLYEVNGQYKYFPTKEKVFKAIPKIYKKVFGTKLKGFFLPNEKLHTPYMGSQFQHHNLEIVKPFS